jgi:hypothetical protein
MLHNSKNIVVNMKSGIIFTLIKLTNKIKAK